MIKRINNTINKAKPPPNPQPGPTPQPSDIQSLLIRFKEVLLWDNSYYVSYKSIRNLSYVNRVEMSAIYFSKESTHLPKTIISNNFAYYFFHDFYIDYNFMKSNRFDFL